jgi:chorismate-pyruvate lyase
MSTTAKSKLSDSPVTAAALLELCKPFVADGFEPQCAVVQPDEIPHPQDQLLVHHEHMTVVLERHHGSAVRVHVLEEHLDGDLYTRKISLTRGGNGGESDTVVEWGIVRLDFRYMDPDVRDEILRKQMPLGAILIKHDVLRRIKPRWFLRFPPGGPVLGLFGDAATTQPAYGRVGTIYCNEEPAIELLEIVVNCDK